MEAQLEDNLVVDLIMVNFSLSRELRISLRRCSEEETLSPTSWMTMTISLWEASESRELRARIEDKQTHLASPQVSVVSEA